MEAARLSYDLELPGEDASVRSDLATIATKTTTTTRVGEKTKCPFILLNEMENAIFESKGEVLDYYEVWFVDFMIASPSSNAVK
jgi:hypothetical protein